MKISVSLPAQDVEFLDSVARERGASRSEVLRGAVRMLRSTTLVDEYVDAFGEWTGSDDADQWERVAGDGIEADTSRRDLVG
jgi:Arc/MetJ-type ribon-helix-helix transcriptional regulator